MRCMRSIINVAVQLQVAIEAMTIGGVTLVRIRAPNIRFRRGPRDNSPPIFYGLPMCKYSKEWSSHTSPPSISEYLFWLLSCRRALRLACSCGVLIFALYNYSGDNPLMIEHRKFFK